MKNNSVVALLQHDLSKPEGTLINDLDGRPKSDLMVYCVEDNE